MIGTLLQPCSPTLVQEGLDAHDQISPLALARIFVHPARVLPFGVIKHGWESPLYMPVLMRKECIELGFPICLLPWRSHVWLQWQSAGMLYFSKTKFRFLGITFAVWLAVQVSPRTRVSHLPLLFWPGGWGTGVRPKEAHWKINCWIQVGLSTGQGCKPGSQDSYSKPSSPVQPDWLKSWIQPSGWCFHRFILQ